MGVPKRQSVRVSIDPMRCASRRAKFKDTHKAFEAFDGPDGNGVLGLREFEEGMRCANVCAGVAMAHKVGLQTSMVVDDKSMATVN